MNTCLLLTLMAAVSVSASLSAPKGATLELNSNFEYATAYKHFRVLYHGVSDEASYISDGQCAPATIKIFKDNDCKEFMTYEVPASRQTQQGIFYFANNNATPGHYQVQVCHGDKTCSYRTRSFSKIPESDERGQLTCTREKFNATTNQTYTVGSFAIDVIPAKEFASNVTAFKGLVDKGVQTGLPSYKDGVLYAGFNYNLRHYWQLFDTLKYKTDEEKNNIKENGIEFSNEYCDRKYVIMASYTLVNPKTNEIEYRFKTTLYGPDWLVKKYILKSDAKEVPIAFDFKAKVKPASYKVWLSICIAGKDIPDFKVECSDPVIGDLTVSENAESEIEA